MRGYIWPQCAPALESRTEAERQWNDGISSARRLSLAIPSTSGAEEMRGEVGEEDEATTSIGAIFSHQAIFRPSPRQKEGPSSN
eukprot:scaffold23789_cov142-Isochrysis_galbana.AAC.1